MLTKHLYVRIPTVLSIKKKDQITNIQIIIVSLAKMSTTRAQWNNYYIEDFQNNQQSSSNPNGWKRKLIHF